MKACARRGCRFQRADDWRASRQLDLMTGRGQLQSRRQSSHRLWVVVMGIYRQSSMLRWRPAPSSYKFAAIPRRNPCQPYQSILIASTTGRMTRWANFRSSSAFRLRGKHRARFGIAHGTPISIQDLGQLPNHTDRAALARVFGGESRCVRYARRSRLDKL